MSASQGSSCVSAAAAPVANPPRMTCGVTQAGRSSTGAREPIRSRPLAMPRSTAAHCRMRVANALAGCA
jgi:hypothetical protein